MSNISNFQALQDYETEHLGKLGFHVGQVVGAQRWGLSSCAPSCWVAPHAGVLMSVLDPRVWDNTLAVPGVASQKQVVEIVDRLIRGGMNPWNHLPVRWAFTEADGQVRYSILGQSPDWLRPYELDIEQWSEARIEAWQEQDRRQRGGQTTWRSIYRSVIDAWRAAGEAVTFASLSPDTAVAIHLQAIEGARILTAHDMSRRATPDDGCAQTGPPHLGEVVFSAVIAESKAGRFEAEEAFDRIQCGAKGTIADNAFLLRALSLWSSQTHPGFRVMAQRDVDASWDAMRMRA